MAPQRSHPVAVEPATAGADNMEACGGPGNEGGMDDEGSAKGSCEHKKLWAKSSIFRYLS